MIVPEYIQPGDKIGLVSTASKIDREVVIPAVELLISLGYEVKLGQYVFKNHHQFAGTDEQRTSDLQSMLDDDEIKAVICSRGGYGSLRTIQGISWDKFLQSPKWIIGFSDITVLHSQLNIFRIASIHGVMPRYFTADGKPTRSFNTFLNSVTGKPQEFNIEPCSFNKNGKTQAELLGGNLSILYSLRGTPYDIDTNNKVLFIEDLSEYLYHLDRIMMNLKTGGKLANLKGLIVGSFTGMKDNDTPYGKTVEEIILDAVSDYDYPVVFNFPAGHQAENYALKFGCDVQIKATDGEVIVSQ